MIRPLRTGSCDCADPSRYQGSWGVAEKVTELALQHLKNSKTAAKL